MGNGLVRTVGSVTFNSASVVSTTPLSGGGNYLAVTDTTNAANALGEASVEDIPAPTASIRAWLIPSHSTTDWTAPEHVYDGERYRAHLWREQCESFGGFNCDVIRPVPLRTAELQFSRCPHTDASRH